MLKKTLAALTLGAALFAGQAMAADYAIDKQGQHAFINFKISHLGYSWLYGTFKDFDGKFSFDAAKPEASSVSVSINTASVDSNHAELRPAAMAGRSHVATKINRASPSDRPISASVVGGWRATHAARQGESHRRLDANFAIPYSPYRFFEVPR